MRISFFSEYLEIWSISSSKVFESKNANPIKSPIVA